ncbi:MAG: leucine-rich repeat protein [Erysipelotrichaceae bacterium]|nr:leucine-rich repeat protein [Erysipelotrichaceae bacterium]
MSGFKDNEFGPWYENRHLITEVVVENGVTSIGSNAFFDCNNLVKVTLADSVTSIGSYAFMECDSLRSVSLGNGLTSIGSYAFKFCYSIQSIKFPDSLQFLGLEAFQGCKSLASLVIPASVTTMQESVFSYCTDLMQVIVNASISELPMWTFYGCDSLVNVTLSETVVSVGQSAFHNCESLNSVSSPASSDITQNLTNQIQEDVAGFIGVNGDPVSDSSFTNSNESGTIQKEVIDNEEVFVKGSINETDTQIDVEVKDKNGWETVIDKTNQYVDVQGTLKQESAVEVNINIDKNIKVDKEMLKEFAGKNVVLNVEYRGLQARIQCSNLNEDERYTDLNLDYALDKIKTYDDSMKAVLGESEAFSLTFKGIADYPMTIKIPLGLDYAYGYATLFEKDGKEWKLIHSVRIDSKGNAALYLNGFDPLTKYMIGLNLDGVNITNAYIPSELAGDYGILTDENGNMYEVTGIQSKWGITLNQFSLIVFGALGGVIVLVGLVMFIIFKMQQNKEKIRREVMNESKK